MGIADLGRAFYYKEAVSNAARQALRTAVLSNEHATGDTVCTPGGASAKSASASTTLPPASGNTLETIGNQASLESTSSGAPGGTAISGATLTVTWHCLSKLALTSTTATATDPSDVGSAAVEVQITYPMSLITPLLGKFVGGNPVTIAADLQARAQY